MPSKLDQLYIQCNKLANRKITPREFELWVLEYYANRVTTDPVYAMVRAAVIHLNAVNDEVMRILADHVIGYVEEHDAPSDT